MSLLPSRWAQSSLGEKCALYLESVAGYIPVSLSRLLLSDGHAVGRSGRPIHDYGFITAALLLPILLLLAIVFTMSWRAPFNFLRRPSFPVHSNQHHHAPPQVHDSDFSYITPDETARRPAAAGGGPGSDAEPDILLLKHLGVTYPLHFPAYAIDDGELTVGELRQLAAQTMKAATAGQIKLLYKGKLLKDDARPCKAEGLKQQSEVLCVVSGVQAPSDEDSEGSEARSRMVEEEPKTSKDKKNKKKNKGKGKSKGKGKTHPEESAAAAGGLDPNSLAPPMDQRPSSSGRSGAPSPAPSLNSLGGPREQVAGLAAYFRGVLLPPCEKYIQSPPTEAKARDFEHKKLSETIMMQVMLKADEIDPNGDDQVRSARRALIKEVQSILSQLDSASMRPSI
ncbi:hypothetical protein ASPZODRAFT_131130 [Penicilliopsis zonata CBS 506.65]|uniref:BAG domain-containing protein n=1 Tax=Penicilliopsis zonata CBS 506.65 TaxID=1073090 RepID=A0A1L9SKK5_9EURO|nr:hypothetical protein ASPZODRAFT_131130 [Penicilliopsis zonata CBS 506.65]OJJ47594.1 hypothetical protein ASPZODRAFT_131130 [Penicilliopsis zonata CBS 506.65]